MIYPCPHCDTNLELQTVHLGKELTCPECGKTFKSEEIPPVVVALSNGNPNDLGFFQVLKVVIYTFISLFVIAAACWGAYLGVKRYKPSLIKDIKPAPKAPTLDEVISKMERSAPERTIIYVREVPVQQATTPAAGAGDSDIRQKNREAEQKFIKELESAVDKK